MVVKNKGQLYEEDINQLLDNKDLLPNELGENDSGFIYGDKSYYVEIKNCQAPDFGQKGMVWNKDNGWSWRQNDIITELYDDFGVFNFIDEGFVPRRYTINKDDITKEDKVFDQQHIEKSGIKLDSVDYLYEYYKRKNCFYIQIEDKGFYYLQKDIANLGVPQYKPSLTLRLRAKTHHSIPIYQYSFFAVIQIGKKPNQSSFDLEEKVGIFPSI